MTLSGGQRQRIAITRALVGDPGFLMLDDSTSAIDPILEGEILDALRKNLSTTTLVVAHRLSTIKLAKRVLFLHQGSIVASGIPRRAAQKFGLRRSRKSLRTRLEMTSEANDVSERDRPSQSAFEILRKGIATTPKLKKRTCINCARSSP